MKTKAFNSRSSEIEDLVKLSFFTDVGKAITSAASLKETLAAVMKQIGEIFAPLNWSLFLRDFKTGDLKFALVTGSGADQLMGRTVPRGRGIAGWIAEKGQSVIIEDVTKDSRFSGEMDAISGFVTKSIIGVPLISRNRVFGVIELINKLNGDSFTALDLKILTTIADFAAIAIEKSYYLSTLKRLATTDELTGLSNRRSLVKSLDRENERCKRYGTTYTVLLIDIDDFKSINDTYGHAAGDKVLKRLAKVIKDQTRTVDTPSRYGGDEFVVLLPDSKASVGLEVKDRILQALAKENSTESVRFNVSIGVHEGNADNFEELLHCVDANMYREKILKNEQSFTNLSENIATLINEE